MLHSLYYFVKPLIPRRIQIQLRRAWVHSRMAKHAHVWPIDERASKKPEGWQGWPDGKKFALVLTHDVEGPKGHERCLILAQIEEQMGFRSSFNFVAEQYGLSRELFKYLNEHGFEIGIHGLKHHGNLFQCKKAFDSKVPRINGYLKEWNAVGFRAPSMYHNLDWMHALDIEYDSSTFDTDPFEPQPDGAGTIFPFWVPENSHGKGYVELPYTLPQDFTLFTVLKEKNIDTWKRKLDWVAEHGGMALLLTHSDYMNFNGNDHQIGRASCRERV
jgi:peptidoglycan/xylan/chitin deacetylase (PgdA/CDA1 family)